MDSDDATSTAETEMEQSVHELPRSRRSVLALGVSGLAAGIAGCSSVVNETSTATGASESSVFTDISFEGQQMVVGLAEGHSVERLNLIGPKGKAFTSEAVAKGSTSVEIQILDLEVNSGDYDHYTPGSYELVAKIEGDTESRDVELDPNIKIVDVAPYENPETESVTDTVITVENQGTGPTWIFDIGFLDAPNEQASELGSQPGVPEVYLSKPEDAEETIVLPGSKTEFVSGKSPFRFETKSACEGKELQSTVVLQTATKTQVKRPIRASFSGGVGNKETIASQDRFMCENASFSIQRGE